MSVATALSLAALVVFGVYGLWVTKVLRIILGVLFAIIFLVCGKALQWSITAYRAFSYEWKRQLSRKIIEGTAKYITLPDGGMGLDIGCGSGALTIACAKQNPQGNMVGVDRWGKDYAEFSLSICQSNAKAENVINTAFQKGDATKLHFADETFDAVTSNYVYHNISGYDKQRVLLETLRVLKKGGTFAIHDLMGKNHYGDMDFLPYPDGSGYEGRFTKCGICVLTKELGLFDLTPAMCALDYTMSEAGGATKFVRQYTLANGDAYCDYGYKKKSSK